MSLLASLNVTTTLAHLLSSLFVSSILKLPAEAYRLQGVQRLKPTLLSLSSTNFVLCHSRFFLLSHLPHSDHFDVSLSLLLYIHSLSYSLYIFSLSLMYSSLCLSFSSCCFLRCRPHFSSSQCVSFQRGLESEIQ